MRYILTMFLPLLQIIHTALPTQYQVLSCSQRKNKTKNEKSKKTSQKKNKKKQTPIKPKTNMPKTRVCWFTPQHGTCPGVWLTCPVIFHCENKHSLSWQVLIANGFFVHFLFSVLGFRLVWTCVGLVHAVTARFSISFFLFSREHRKPQPGLL